MSPIQITTKADVTIIYFTDSRLMGLKEVKEAGEALRASVPRNHTKNLVINFRVVRYLATTMLNELIHLNRMCTSEGIELKLCEIAPNIMEVFRITKLHKLFDISATEERALKRLHVRGC